MKTPPQEAIQKIIDTCPIEAILFDLDDTLIKEHAGVISDVLITWLKQLTQQNLKIGIITNNMSQTYCKKALEQLKESNIEVVLIYNAFKPLSFSFKKIISTLNTTPDKTIMVGDGLLTDYLGAKFAGLKFVEVSWYNQNLLRKLKLFPLRELVIILGDWLRFIFLKHRSTILYSHQIQN